MEVLPAEDLLAEVRSADAARLPSTPGSQREANFRVRRFQRFRFLLKDIPGSLRIQDRS
jgi:hypothetical protein